MLFLQIIFPFHLAATLLALPTSNGTLKAKRALHPDSSDSLSYDSLVEMSESGEYNSASEGVFAAADEESDSANRSGQTDATYPDHPTYTGANSESTLTTSTEGTEMTYETSQSPAPGSGCPELFQLPHPRTGVPIRANSLGSGSYGCAYLVQDGTAGIRFVAKTTKDPLKTISPREVAALQRIREFEGWVPEYTIPGETETRSFVYEKYHEGVGLRRTQGYSEYVSESGAKQIDPGKNVAECLAFLEVTYAAICARALKYVDDYELYHNDIHLGNIIFPKDWPSQLGSSMEENWSQGIPNGALDAAVKSIDFVDWGRAYDLEDLTAARIIVGEWSESRVKEIQAVCNPRRS